MKIDTEKNYIIPGSVLAGILEYIGKQPCHTVVNGYLALVQVAESGPVPDQDDSRPRIQPKTKTGSVK